MEQKSYTAYFMEHYLPRDEIAYRLPVSVSLSDAWREILRERERNAVRLPLLSWDGHPYWYVPTNRFNEAGDRFMEAARDEAVSAMPQYENDGGIIDEAFFSSVIEGAYSTRQRAREFIMEGTPPKDRSEQMILNNYEALRFALEHVDDPINEAVVLEIARILTKGTLEDSVRAGYRDGPVQVVSGRQEIVYEAPDASCIKSMMDALLTYIADPEVHPVVKACVTQIYFVTIHPFYDGNGRTARALSYLILLKAGYHFMRQVTISGILAQERAKYYKAIMACQNPANGYDFTYFLEFYADLLSRSVDGIHAHMAVYRALGELEKRLSGDEFARVLKGARWLAAEDIETITTEKWKSKFGVSFETARRDLTKLEEEGFVVMRTVGRKHFYGVTKSKKEVRN